MGLGFAGMLRRFVVYPIQALWPNILPTVALNRALLVKETHESINGWRMSRYKFFFIFFIGMTVYFWLPGFLFPVSCTQLLRLDDLDQARQLQSSHSDRLVIRLGLQSSLIVGLECVCNIRLSFDMAVLRAGSAIHWNVSWWFDHSRGVLLKLQVDCLPTYQLIRHL